MSMACQTQKSYYDDGLQNTEILPCRWPPNIQSLHDMWSDLKSVKGLLRMCCWHTGKCWMTTVWCVNNACFSNIDLSELTELTLQALSNCVKPFVTGEKRRTGEMIRQASPHACEHYRFSRLLLTAICKHLLGHNTENPVMSMASKT
jgi:hypothetical protein